MSVADPSELSMVLNSALPATFTFLYQRLDVLLSRNREGEAPQTEALPEVPAVVTGELELPLRSDGEQVHKRLAELRAYAHALAQYRQDPSLVTSEDPLLLQTLGDLREALEEIYGQRLTFEGEPRHPSGPFSEQRHGRVAGEAVGMEATERISGSASTRITTDTVEAGGKVVGMRAPIIGDRR
jgi:hypothetical protein